jgi:hypothetical protein
VTTFSKTALSLLLLAGGFVVAKTLGPPDLAQKLVSSWRPDASNQWGELRPAAQGDHQAEWLAPLDAIEMPASFSSSQASAPVATATTPPAAQPWPAPPQQSHQANKVVQANKAVAADAGWPALPEFGAPPQVAAPGLQAAGVPPVGFPSSGFPSSGIQSAGGQPWGGGSSGQLQTSSYEEEMVDLRQYNQPAIGPNSAGQNSAGSNSAAPSAWPASSPVQAKEVSAGPGAGWPQSPMNQAPMTTAPPTADAWPGAPSAAAWPSAPPVQSDLFGGPGFGPAGSGATGFGGPNSPPASPGASGASPMLQASASPPAQWSQEAPWSDGASHSMAPLGQGVAPEGDLSEAAARKTHIVADGDSLPKLAERYLGDSGRSAELYERNRQLLTHPDLLPLGVELQIP